MRQQTKDNILKAMAWLGGIIMAVCVVAALVLLLIPRTMM